MGRVQLNELTAAEAKYRYRNQQLGIDVFEGRLV